MIYTISNTGNVPLSWRVTSSVNWISLTPASGSVQPMQQSNVVVGINVMANNFAPRTYTGSLSFQNTTTGIGNTTRYITLIVNPSGSSSMNVFPTASFVYSGSQGGPFGFWV